MADASIRAQNNAASLTKSTESDQVNGLSPGKHDNNVKAVIETENKNGEVSGTELRNEKVHVTENKDGEINKDTESKNGKATNEPKQTNQKELNGTKKSEGKNPQEEGAELIASGKRSLAIKDYEAAIEAFATACEILIPVHGELSDEMAELYFDYGQALLYHARSQNGVLGDKIEKEEEDDGDDDGDDDDDDDDDGVDNNEETENGGDKEKNDGAEKTEESTKEKEAKMEVDNKEVDAEPKEEDEVNLEETKGEAEENENADDLQLSWQFLDMARVIYEKKADESKDIAIKLSDVLLSLGENALEAENYPTAISDMELCLKLQRKHLPEDDRRIAESLFQIGVAHLLNKDFKNAEKLFLESIGQLEKKISNLSGSDGNEEEISDMKEAIKEIKEKVADARASEEILKTTLASKLAEGLPHKSDAPSPSSSKSLSDITHLIRKKRKNEDEAEEGNIEENKKPKIE